MVVGPRKDSNCDGTQRKEGRRWCWGRYRIEKQQSSGIETVLPTLSIYNKIDLFIKKLVQGPGYDKRT